MDSKRISRRDFLRGASISGVLLLGGLDAVVSYPALFERAAGSAASGAVTVRAQTEPFVPDAEISLTASEQWVQILPGAKTRVWSYQGQLLSGSGVTVQAVPGSYLGPIPRVQSGKKLRIYFHNNLAEKSVVHPHGLRVPEDCDGQPMQAIDPGQTKVYEFQVIDRAGPYWFHPHPMGRTAEQVVMAWPDYST